MQSNHSPLPALILSSVIFVSAAGCAAPIILAVGAGAVGGYAVSRDTFEGVTGKSQEELWEGSNRVTSIMGMIENSDRRQNQIIAIINGARVTITIVPVNLTTTKLRIKARKNIFPAVDIAQQVYSKIMNQLEQN